MFPISEKNYNPGATLVLSQTSSFYCTYRKRKDIFRYLRFRLPCV